MEERKTAAIVIGVILLVFLIFKLWPQKPEVISFKGCRVEYHLANDGLDGERSRVSYNKLGLCLCETYLVQKNEDVARKIMDIYRKNGAHYVDSLGTMGNVDSVIKYRSALLDTLVLID